MTLFAACLGRLGLSQVDAARLLGWSVQRVKDRCSGRSRVPDGVWSELRAYEALIVDRSEATREALEEASQDRSQPDRVDAVIDDMPGLMGLADFVLTNDVLPGNVMVGIARR